MEPTPTAVLSAQEKASPSDTGLFGCDMLEKSLRQGPWSPAVDKSKSYSVPSAMPRDPDPGVMVPHRRIRPLFLWRSSVCPLRRLPRVTVLALKAPGFAAGIPGLGNVPGFPQSVLMRNFNRTFFLIVFLLDFVAVTRFLCCAPSGCARKVLGIKGARVKLTL